MSRQVDKKNEELPTLFAKVLEIIDIKQVDFALECRINPGTLSKALERKSFSDDIVDKIHDRYGVREAYWDDGKEPIFDKKGTYVETPSHNKQNGANSKETFYRDIIEDNDEYSLIPRAVLRDYKIVPDKIIDVLVQSNENEKKALIESKELEIKGLNDKYELIIDGLKNKTSRLEADKEELIKEIERLRRQIPGQN